MQTPCKKKKKRWWDSQNLIHKIIAIMAKELLKASFSQLHNAGGYCKVKGVRAISDRHKPCKMSASVAIARHTVGEPQSTGCNQMS